jgi:hypothetical protein
MGVTLSLVEDFVGLLCLIEDKDFARAKSLTYVTHFALRSTRSHIGKFCGDAASRDFTMRNGFAKRVHGW